MKWTKIEDGLPKFDEKVLLYCQRQSKGDRRIVIGNRCNDRYIDFQSWDFHEDENVKVTHWMPLPAPPKEEPPSKFKQTKLDL